MKTKKILSLVLAGVMALALAAPAFADTAVNALDDATNPGQGTTTVTLTAAANTTFSVTVPTSIPLTVNADGTATVGALTIVNKSTGPVQVSGIAITAKTDNEDGKNWTTMPYDISDTDLAKENVNANRFGLQFSVIDVENKTSGSGVIKTTGANQIGFASGSWRIAGATDTSGVSSSTTPHAKATAVSSAYELDNIASIVITIGWATT